MTLVCALVLVASGLQQAELPDPHRSLLREIVPHPTGRNGYEEFLAAADIMASPRVRQALDMDRGLGADLAHARQAAELAQPAFALVRRGLQKPVFEPREAVDFTTLFPELAMFRNLARAYSIEVRVRFADGEPRQAVRAAVEGLRFSRSIPRSLAIHDLVSVACEAIIFAALDRHLIHISEPDAVLLARVAEEMLAEEPHWFAIAVQEAELAKRQLAGFLEKPDDPAFEWMLDPALGELPPEALALPQAPPARRAAIQREFANYLGLVLDELRERASKPESQWLVPTRTFEPTDPLVAFLSGGILMLTEFLPSTHARVRTQYRLLRLHMGITQFRWRHQRLPSSLAELGQPAWLQDPLSGEPFQYRPTGGLSYELYSIGAGDIGRVDLRYVRARPPEGRVPGMP